MTPLVPDDLAEAVRRASIATPPYTGSLDEVRGRVAARRRRRVAGGSLLSVLAVAAAVGVPYAVLRPSAPTVLRDATTAATSAPPAPPVAAEPAQLLLLSFGGMISTPGGAGDPPVTIDPAKPNYGFPSGSTGIVTIGGIKELRPDGTVVTHARFGEVLLADGRIVSLSPKDLAPGVPRTDGPCVSDLAFMLEVTDTAGTVTVARDVREMCRVVMLVGSSPDEAYLVRGPAEWPAGARLVAHRFADGVERDVVGLNALGGRVSDLHLTAGLAVSVGGSEGDGCDLAAVSLASGATVASFDAGPGVPTAHCDRARLSPDGRLVAVTVDNLLATGRSGDLRVLDLATGALVASHEIYASTTADEQQRKFAPKGFAGVAWVDDSHVRVAWVDPPDEERILTVEEVVRASTFHVAA